MSEQMGWIIVLGLAVAIAGIFILSSQLEKNLRETLEFLIRSNDMIAAHLERRLGPSAHPPEEPLVGIILERRFAQRRSPPTRLSPRPGNAGQRRSPGRRSEDLQEIRERSAFSS